MGRLNLEGAFIVTPKGVFRGTLSIVDGRIEYIGPKPRRGKPVDCDGCYILPGFRDQHIHDHVGFTEHPTDPERLSRVSRALASQGVTAYMLATTAAPTDRLVQYMESIRSYMESGRNGLDGARVEGVNVEGTFIREECAGAQPREYIIPPNRTDAKAVLDKFMETGVVKLVNIAPDFGVDLIEYAASRGLIVGCGHCLATANQLAEAYKAGLRYIVHLTNGPIGQSFKPFYGGGTYEGALILPLFIELIIDGYHVDFRYISDIIWRRVQQGRSHEIVAVTDGIFPVQEEIPDGEFRLYSTLCVKSKDGGVFVVKGRIGERGEIQPVPPCTLCSSKLTMDKAFENLLNLLTVDFQGFMIDREALPLHEAVRYASLFTSSNQALLQGVSSETGSVEVGKKADLTVLRITGREGRYKVKVEMTIVDGRIFKSS